jgi:hypothetical protein
MAIAATIAWAASVAFIIHMLIARETSKTTEKNFLRELQAKDAEIEALKKHINQSRSEAKEPSTNKP